MATEQAHPNLDDPAARAEAADALDRLVSQLQEGHELADADAFDRQFASDVLRGDGRWWLAAGQNTPIADRPA